MRQWLQLVTELRRSFPSVPSSGSSSRRNRAIKTNAEVCGFVMALIVLCGLPCPAQVNATGTQAFGSFRAVPDRTSIPGYA